MENNYKVFMGVETETKKVFEKHLIAQGYQIIEVDLKEILFAKKSIGTETEEDIETEQVAIRILIGIIKKYLGISTLSMFSISHAFTISFCFHPTLPFILRDKLLSEMFIILEN